MAEHRHWTRIAGLYRRFWYVPDVVAVVFLFLYLTFLNLAPTDYIGGLHNDGAWAFTVGLGYACGLMPVALIGMVVVAVRMGISWPRHIQAPGRLLRWRLLVGVGLGAWFVFFFTPLRPAGCVAFTHGFRKYVQAHADIAAIRTWLSGMDPNTCTGRSIRLRDAQGLENAHWPDAVMSLHPESLELCLDSNRRPMVRLAWSGFDSLWGVTVGSEEMEIPATLPRRKVQVGASMMYEDGEYRLPVEPGVYVWHGIW